MNIIVPMAGMGKRLRPHTLTIPKPLVPVAGKPIVQHLVEDIVKVANQPVERIAFIIKASFGEAIENSLKAIADSLGAEGVICYQEEALGTAHAILCAKECLEGKVVVAFADTLFKADFQMDTEAEGVIWVQQVEDPSAYGVVKMDENGVITEFIEKPDTPVSNLAIIGIYYFSDGAYLRDELQYLIDNNIKEKGEYQITNALENMKQKGTKFVPGEISEWLDCGNKKAAVHANQRYLEFIKDRKLVADSAKIENSVILPPVFIAENVEIKNSIVGPHVSIGENSSINNTIIKNTIVQSQSKIENANFFNSMIGNFVEYIGSAKDISLGDYNVIQE